MKTIFDLPKLLHFANTYSFVIFTNGNNIPYLYQPYRNLLAFGNTSLATKISDFTTLASFLQNNKKWLFGNLGYDLKNRIENLKSENKPIDSFAEIFFFEPEYVIEIIGEEYLFLKGDKDIFLDKYAQFFLVDDNFEQSTTTIHSLTSKSDYLANVEKIKNHIIEGDIYEANYCIAFEKYADINPVSTYLQLNNLSPAPFSCFYKQNDNYLLCASPERFIKKEGNKLISQPIKGTSKRSANKEEDENNKQQLLYSEKERAENLMIVDLVRNDLAKSSNAGTTQVEELFGIYSFAQVHQMISTVTSEIKTNFSEAEIIKNAFPMGSMTGAPKIKTMELIERYENFKRGIFSGSVGYFTPDKDFDFNVVIRSIIYNLEDAKITYAVGSAITFDSEAEQEYKECMLKAEAILKIIS